MSECICPTIVITCIKGQITEEQIRYIAHDTYSMVSVEYKDGSAGRTNFGPHRSDCPCHPNN